MLGTVLLFTAFAFVLVEIVQARARVALATWALLLVTIALLLSFFKSI